MAATIPQMRRRLAGWGNYPVAECTVTRPEKIRALESCAQNSDSLLARGLGRSYGDAALNPPGVALMERLDRFIAFDTHKGILTTQAGIALTQVLDVVIPQGWIVPVLPGTKQVTLGGMAACDVHGKNHYRQGTIGRHILALKLRLPQGAVTICSRENEPELFYATLGGMGLTGIIEEVTLQLQPIKSLSLQAQAKRVANLQDMLAAFAQAKETHEYMVGWIDHMARGTALGQGVFEKANHAEAGTALSEYRPQRQRFAVPCFAPGWLLNKYTMTLYNRRHFARYGADWQARQVDFSGFFHPLDGIGQWNRLYGRRGFLQYQCLLPEGPEVAAALRQVLEMIHEAGAFSFLAVLKYHGAAGEGYLSFPQPGYSLALDFPNTAKVQALQQRLNAFVRAQRGRVYLAKDATLSAEDFAAMYAEGLLPWRRVAARIDPQRRMDSLMAKRLNMRGEQ